MLAKPIRVLLVDDSRFFRDYMSKALSADMSVQVVGTVADPADVMQMISEYNPNVIALDIEIQNLNYRDFISNMRKLYPHLPIVVISPLGPAVFDALKAGAVDFVAKPSAQLRFDNAAFIREVLAKIKTVYAGAYTRQPGPADPLRAAKSAEGFAAAAARSVAAATGSRANPAPNPNPRPAVPVPPLPSSAFFPCAERRIVAIGASTGGTEAILSVVRNLPANTPGIVVVQHMPPVFTRMYAERLDKTCNMAVQEAKNGDRVRPGQIFIAEGNKQMRVLKDSGGYFLRVEEGEKVSGHCPSVDVMFESVATAAGPDAVGVILTGMGGDGAKNLLKMREAGAYTIGQDEASCVVYGMPMVAYTLGAVVDQLPLDQIPGAILRHLTRVG